MGGDDIYFGIGSNFQAAIQRRARLMPCSGAWRGTSAIPTVIARRSSALPSRDRRGSSDAARRDVAIDLSISPEKDDAMSGRVSFVPFDFAVRDDDPFSYLAVWSAKRAIRALVGDDRHVATIIHLEAVSPICVGFATARLGWNVGPHEPLKPLAHIRRLNLPLSKVARCHR